MATDLRASLAAETPPADVSALLQALWWLKKGGFVVGREWERAHEIAQGHEGTREFDLVHALAHWIEGDRGNSDYWYRRAGSRRSAEDIPGEWEHLVTAFGG